MSYVQSFAYRKNKKPKDINRIHSEKELDSLNKSGRKTKINFNQFLCKPIELNLEIEDKTTGKMTILDKKTRKKEKIKDFTYDQSQGLLSQLKSYKNEEKQKEELGVIQQYNIRLMICITVYNEGADQLEMTLKGVEKNLSTLRSRCGLKNQEIAVVIIFDGIDRINNEQGSKINQNMLKQFDIYDRLYKIAPEDSLRNQYNTYKKMVEDSKINPEEYFKKNNNQEISVIKLGGEASKIFLDKKIKLIQKKMEDDKKNLNYRNRYESLLKQSLIKALENNQEEKDLQDMQKEYFLTAQEEEKLQRESLKQVKKNAQNYIDERRDNAWLYQIRSMVYDEKELGKDQQKVQDKQEQLLYDDDDDSDSDQEDTGEDQQKLLNQFEKDQKYAVMDDKQKLEQDWNDINQQVDEDLDTDYLNIFFCFKFRNAKKLNSHLWFFKGFCDTLKPDYVALLDCGLEPDKDALYEFFINMEADKNLGGVCGFMGLRPERNTDDKGERLDGFDMSKVDWLSAWVHSFFDIQKAQVFEYNFAHIIDKAFESLFGFIHVLPGAFSAYRYAALEPYKRGKKTIIDENNAEREVDAYESILDAYLKTQLDPSASHESLQEANMYLAEDRILCLSLFTHFNEKYTLKYVPRAHAMVDPIMNLTAFLGQRRRWINGSWFALNHVLDNYCDEVKGSRHSAWRKMLLYISMIYAQLGQFLTYFAIALYFSALLMVYESIFGNKFIGQPDLLEEDHRFDASSLSWLSIFIFGYFMIVGGMIFYSLQYSHSNKVAYRIYYGISTVLGIYMLISFYFMVYGIIESVFLTKEEDLGTDTLFDKDEIKYFQYMIYVTIAGHALPVLLNPCKKLEKIWELLVSTPSYLFYMPTYIHMLIIFSFCRIDDLSWGTKGDNTAESNNLEQGKGKQSINKEDQLRMEVMQLEIKRKAEKLKQDNENYKFNFFFKWIIYNMLFAFAFAYLARSDDTQKGLLLSYGYLITGLVIIRAAGSMLFYILDWFSEFLIWFSKQSKKKQYEDKSKGIESVTRKMIKDIFKNKNNQDKNSLVYNVMQEYKKDQRIQKEQTESQVNFLRGFLQNGQKNIEYKEGEDGLKIPQIELFMHGQNQNISQQDRENDNKNANKLINNHS